MAMTSRSIRGHRYQHGCTHRGNNAYFAKTTKHRAARLGPQATTSAADTPYTPRGALPLPQSLRTVAPGQRADGSAVTAQAVWFARAAGPEVRLFHAVVYSQKPRPEVAEQFFAGLALP